MLHLRDAFKELALRSLSRLLVVFVRVLNLFLYFLLYDGLELANFELLLQVSSWFDLLVDEVDGVLTVRLRNDRAHHK